MVVNGDQLGILPSSARYKRDIREMGNASDKLMKLRPVTFRYKADATGTEQYGLIAEEVEKVYPELVVHGAGGKAQTVAYHVLPAMLLNELQKQAAAARTQAQIVKQQAAQLKSQADQLGCQAEQFKHLSAQVAEQRAVFERRLTALERSAAAGGNRKLAMESGR